MLSCAVGERTFVCALDQKTYTHAPVKKTVKLRELEFSPGAGRVAIAVSLDVCSLLVSCAVYMCMCDVGCLERSCIQ